MGWKIDTGHVVFFPLALACPPRGCHSRDMSNAHTVYVIRTSLTGYWTATYHHDGGHGRSGTCIDLLADRGATAEEAQAEFLDAARVYGWTGTLRLRDNDGWRELGQVGAW